MSLKQKKGFFLLITLFLSCVFIQHTYGQGIVFPPPIDPPTPGNTSIPPTTIRSTTTTTFRSTSSIRTTTPTTSTSVTTTTTSIECVDEACVAQPGWVAEPVIEDFQDVACDSVGNCYGIIAFDIYKVAADGTVSPVAGDFGSPQYIAVDGGGNIYIANENDGVQKVTPSGNITTAYTYNYAYWWWRYCDTADMAVDSSGNLYFAFRGSGETNAFILKVDAGGNEAIIVGEHGCCGHDGCIEFYGDGGPAVDAPLCNPSGIAIDTFDILYIADRGYHRVFKVAGGIISTVAGNGCDSFSGNGGPATAANIYPFNVAVDGPGNIYIHTTSGLSRVDLDHNITTLYCSSSSYAYYSSWMGPLAVDSAQRVYVSFNAGLSRVYYRDCVDADGDGYGVGPECLGSDCDDNDASVYPGEGGCAVWYQDADGDGYGNLAVTTVAIDQPAGYVADSTDCDDSNANVHSRSTELCAAPDLYVPSGDGPANSRKRTFKWQRTDAQTYTLQGWSESANSSSISISYNASEICDGCTCSVTPDTIFPVGRNWWWLNTWSQDCGYREQPGGKVKEFTVAPCTAPELYEPSGSSSANSTRRTFKWQRANRDYFEILVWSENGNGISFGQWVAAHDVCIENNCTYVPAYNFPAGNNWWWLNTWGDNCDFEMQPGGNVLGFVVAPCTGGPTLYSPNGDTPFGIPPEFSWQDKGAGSTYQILAWTVAGGGSWLSLYSPWYDSSNCNGTICSATPPSKLVETVDCQYSRYGTDIDKWQNDITPAAAARPFSPACRRSSYP